MNSPAGRIAIPLSIALVAGIILRIYFALATPIASEAVAGHLSSYNDELAHGHYALHLLETGRLPQNIESIETEGALNRGHFENYQPPLYYLLVAGLSTTLGKSSLSGIILVGRFLNVILFLGILGLFVLIGRELALPSVAISSGVMFLSLSGVMVRFSSTATNEALFWLFGSIMLWTALKIMHSGLWFASTAVFFASSVAALYTKLTAILLLPLLALVLLKQRNARMIFLVSMTYVLIAIVTLPLWFRNLHEFGSVFPLAAGFGAPQSAIPGFGFLTYALRSFVFPWQEFWQGWIGLALMLPFFLYLIVSAADKRTSRTLVREPVLSVALLLTCVAFLWLNFRYHQAEARYLFAAWPVVALLFTGMADRVRAPLLLLVVLLLPYALFLLPALGS